jgi:hypothetical protein
MRVFLTVVAGGAALAALAAPAHAQTAPKYSAHDMQCFIAASELADTAEQAEAKNTGLMAAMYFAGKIYGANPKIDFTAALDAETDKYDSVDKTALMKECGAELEAHGNEIEAAGKALLAKGK